MFKLENTDTLILSGGGIKGYYYIGIIKYLEEKDIIKNIKKYSGTSIGSLICFMLCIGYNYTEMINIFYNIEIGKLIKFSIKNIIFEDHWGVYDTSNLRKYLKNIFKYKGLSEDITFQQLYILNKKYLGMIAVNISKNKEIIFDYINTPDSGVLDCILASSNLPVIFPKMIINGELYIDGGFSNNFPINYYISEDNSSILGICLKENELQKTEINNIFHYIKSIFKYYHHSFGNKHNELVSSNIKDNVCILYPHNLNINATDFSLKKESKKQMIMTGYTYIKNYFSNL